MHQATPTSWMMLNREISSWQERALKAEAECERLRAENARLSELSERSSILERLRDSVLLSGIKA